MTQPTPTPPPSPRVAVDLRPIVDALNDLRRACLPLTEAIAGMAGNKWLAGRMRAELRAEARLITEMCGYPQPSPAWLRTVSRRRRAGSRRLRRMVRTRRHDRLWCW